MMGDSVIECLDWKGLILIENSYNFDVIEAVYKETNWNVLKISKLWEYSD